MTDMPNKLWGYRYNIVGITFLLYFINYFDRVAVLTFLPLIQKDLGLSAVQLGWLASTFFFVYACGQVLAGFLCDKIGPKRTMNIAIWAFTLVTGVTAMVQTFWQFICLRVGLALGESQHYAPTLRMLANWFPRNELAKATGMFNSSVSVAPALVPIVCTQLAFLFGDWRPVFIVLAVPGFLGIYLLWKYVSDTPEERLGKDVTEEEYKHITSPSDQSASPAQPVPAADAGEPVRTNIFYTDPHFYIYCCAIFFMNSLFWGYLVWMSTFLVRQHGFDIRTMGFIATAPYVTAFLSQVIGGTMASTWFVKKPKVVGMISFAGCIPSLYWIGQIPKGETALLIIGLICGGFFIHLMYGMMYSWPGRRYPKEVVGRAVGFSNGFSQLGAFLSPLIAGYLVVTLADNSYDFSNVFVFWTGVAVMGLLALSLLNEDDVMKYRARSAAGGR